MGIDWRDSQIRYLVHFDDGGSGMRSSCWHFSSLRTHVRVAAQRRSPRASFWSHVRAGGR
jgi:hypothetical protein